MKNFILVNEMGSWGEIILNRSAAYNALTHDMILEITHHLNVWEKNPNIHAILIRSSHENVFCAGGDIKHIYEKGRTHFSEVLNFFYDEYRLNYLISHYQKPIVVLLNGLTMGGGVGISIYATYRIAFEKYAFAMPETGIGFFPDIGGSYFLSHCKNHCGFYLGLTGMRIHAGDAYALGFVDCIAKQVDYEVIKNHLLSLEPEKIDVYLKNTHQETPSSLPFELINHCFKENSIEAILENLKKENSEWALNILKIIETKSPTSLKVTLEQLNRGKKLNLAKCLQMEYQMVHHFLKNHDFYEGVRAAVIDKDQKPNWSPSSLSKITEKMVDDFFVETKEKLKLF